MIVDCKTCTKCGETKPLDEFSTAPRGKHGRKGSCKVCDAARHAMKLVANGERVFGPQLPPPDPATTYKTCTKCKESKRLTEYYIIGDGKAQPGPIYKPSCKACQSATARKWFRDNPERAVAIKRRLNLQANYGLTPEDYAELLAAQDGKCAICGLDEPSAHGRTGKKFSLSVDHCHGTGRVRGLLCQKCNRAIGLLGDSVELLRKAIDYLERE